MRNDRKASARNNKGSAKSTVSGPRKTPRGGGNGSTERKMKGTQELAAAFPFNASKPGEIGAAARTPKTGPTAEPPDPAVVG
jgi:catalase